MKRLVIILALITFSLQSCSPSVIRRNKVDVAVVKKAPRNHRVVVIKKKRYYTWGGNYYRKTSRGFILVSV